MWTRLDDATGFRPGLRQDFQIAEDGSRLLFREAQGFTQRWLWIAMWITELAVLAAFGLIVFMHAAGMTGQRFGVTPIIHIAIASVVLAAVMVLLYKTCLLTEVRDTGLFVRFFPFHFSFHAIPLQDVKGFRAVTYRPIKEYGGWGIRYGISGKAYTVAGNRGVRLEFHSGKSLLIGSQRPEELEAALREITNC
jgi:hypothetical protein